MPFFLFKDIDTSSPEWNKLDKKTRVALPSMLIPQSPTIGLCLAPQDCIMFDLYMGATYLKAGVQVVMTWRPMDPTKYCSSVSRRDIETVAAAIATAHECGF